jgi:hypothetical protein
MPGAVVLENIKKTFLKPATTNLIYSLQIPQFLLKASTGLSIKN